MEKLNYLSINSIMLANIVCAKFSASWDDGQPFMYDYRIRRYINNSLYEEYYGYFTYTNYVVRYLRGFPHIDCIDNMYILYNCTYRDFFVYRPWGEHIDHMRKGTPMLEFDIWYGSTPSLNVRYLCDQRLKTRVL